MKNSLIYLVLFVSLQTVHSQREAAIWYFGERAGLDFNSGVPIALTDGALSTQEGCSTISDANGNLLFYSNGVTVWNRNHQIMMNGTGLLGNDNSTQSALIVPRPQSPNIYYIFTVDVEWGYYGMNYSEVDMNLDGGLGGITALKNINLIAKSTEKVTAVANLNGEDIWVLGHPFESNQFYSYAVTASGVNSTPVVSNTPLLLDGFNEEVGQLKISPKGDKVGMVSHRSGAYLFDFDNNTGVVSNMVTVTNNKALYGLEFSPSGQRLYVSEQRPFILLQRIFQYDLEAADIGASEVLLAEEEGIGNSLQLGIDSKIYGIASSKTFLCSIENPNALGAACNFIYNSVDLNGRVGLAGLPPFIQSYFTLGITAKNFCLFTPTEFYLNTSEPITSVTWDFGDGGISATEPTNHTYAAPGTFRVTVTVTTATETKMETKDITIYDTPIVNTTYNYEVCTTAPTYEFDLSTRDAQALGALSAADNIVSYYTNALDLVNNTNVLPYLYTNTKASELIYVRLSNRNNPSCYTSTSFDLIVKEAPQLIMVTDWTVCDSDNDTFFNFDLTQKNTEVLGGQNATTFTVNYYNSQANADADTNPLDPNHTNTSSRETIFFRIENSVYPECYESGSFALEVITGVSANTPSPFIACAQNNDGVFAFDLSTKDEEILGAQSLTSFMLSYHATEADAVANQKALPKNDYSNTTLRQTLHVRIQNIGVGTCYALTELELIVQPLPDLGLQDIYTICPDSPKLVIDAGDFETWSWKDVSGVELSSQRTIDIIEVGEYSLTVTQTTNGVSCSKTISFEVISSRVPESLTAEIGDFADKVSLRLVATGSGDFEYSLDGENYQNDNYFEVFPGEYTAFIRDVLLCRTIAKEVMVAGYEKFFTPNGDGFHDQWNFIARELYPDAVIKIFDRYGKFIHQISPGEVGWDGTYNGTPLPASDYWFRYEYNNGKVFDGHFSLKR